MKPGYASSSQCAPAVRAAVEARVGRALAPVAAPPLDGRPVARALRLGNSIELAYGGAGAREYQAEAHIIDEAIGAFVPWASPDYEVIPGEFACFPDAASAFVGLAPVIVSCGDLETSSQGPRFPLAELESARRAASRRGPHAVDRQRAQLQVTASADRRRWA